MIWLIEYYSGDSVIVVIVVVCGNDSDSNKDWD